MSDRQAYVEKFQAKLNQWDSEIENLKAKAAEATADAKIEFHEQIAALEAEQEKAQGKLDELRTAADKQWIDFKYDVEEAYNELNTSIERAMEKLAA